MRTIGGETWSTKVPDSWLVDEDDTCLTVWQENGGALQFSAAYKEGAVTADDLNDFAEDDLQRAASKINATFSQFRGFELRYDSDGHSWRIWYLRSGSTLLFVTFNCSVEQHGTEDDDIDSIMEKLSAEPKT